jgi:hypothetical protein
MSLSYRIWCVGWRGVEAQRTGRFPNDAVVPKRHFESDAADSTA